MNEIVKNLLKTKFGRVKIASGGCYRIPCPTCDANHSKKMKRYICPGWSSSKCFICEQSIPIPDLLGEDVEFAVTADSAPEREYKYSKILPYENAVKLSDMSVDSPVIRFMHKDHLYNLGYYDTLGIRYIPAGCGKNLEFDSGFIVNTSESLFFPVFGYSNEYVGWQIRFIPGTWNGDRLQFMRYLHLFPKGDYLFNYANARKYKNVVVVEGVKKALKLANSVATLGKGVSDNQKKLMYEWPMITLVLDGEDNTQELARGLQEHFTSVGKKCVNVDLRKYNLESPDEATSEQLQWIVEKEHELFYARNRKSV